MTVKFNGELNIEEVVMQYAGESHRPEDVSAAVVVCEKFPFLLHPVLVYALCLLPTFTSALVKDDPGFSDLMLPHGGIYATLDSDIISLLSVVRNLRRFEVSTKAALRWRYEAFEAAALAPTDLSNTVYCAVITARLAQCIGPTEYVYRWDHNEKMVERFYPFDPMLEPFLYHQRKKEFGLELKNLVETPGNEEEIMRLLGSIRRQHGWPGMESVLISGYVGYAVKYLIQRGRVVAFRNGNPALWISEVGGAPRWGYWTK